MAGLINYDRIMGYSAEAAIWATTVVVHRGITGAYNFSELFRSMSPSSNLNVFKGTLCHNNWGAVLYPNNGDHLDH